MPLPSVIPMPRIVLILELPSGIRLGMKLCSFINKEINDNIKQILISTICQVLILEHNNEHNFIPNLIPNGI